MKRLVLLTFIAFSGLLLAGCDLIPTDVADQLSEELCRDNPDNELCDIENLNSIEEDVVKALVQEAFTEIKDGNADACSQVFAITNTDLLDDCMDAVSTLIPTDVTEFEVTEVVKEGDFYIIKGRTNNSDEFIEIKVSVGEVEGNLRITTWEAMTKDDPVLAEQMSAEELIIAFFNDQIDLSSDYICRKYYAETAQDTCSGDLDDLGMSIAYEVLSVRLVEGDIYGVTVQVGSGTETEELFFRLDTDDDGDVVLTTLYRDGEDNDCDGVACPVDGVLGQEDAKMVFMQFLDDFADTTVTNQELADMYFGGTLPEDIKEDREDLAGVTFNFISIMAAEDMFFEIEFEVIDGTNKEVEKVRIKVNRIDMAYKLEIADNVDNDCDGEDDPSCMAEFLDQMELKMLLEAFIADYQDPTVSNEEMLSMYFFGIEMGEFLEERTKDLEEGTMFTFVSLEPIADGEMMMFELTMDVTFDDTTSQMLVVASGMWITEDLAVLMFRNGDEDCDDYGDHCDGEFLDLESTVIFFEDYLVSYLDVSITDQEFANMYYGGMLTDEFMMMREKDLNDNVTITLDTVTERVDSFFDITFRVVMGDDIILRKRPGRIRQQPDLLTAEWMELMDEDLETNIDIVENIFKAFIASYLDPTLTDQEVADMFFGGMLGDMLSERQMDLEDGFMVEYLFIEQMEMGIFAVHLNLTRNNEVEHTDLKIKVKRVDGATPLLMILNGEDNDCDNMPDKCNPDMFVKDPMELENFFKQYLIDYLDPDSDDDTIVDIYFAGMAPRGFFEQREMDLLDVTSMTFLSITSSEEGMDIFFDIEFRTDYKTGTWDTEMVSLSMVMMDDGSTFFVHDFKDNDCDDPTGVCYPDPFVKDPLEVEMIFTDFLNDFANPDITFDEINEIYFMGTAPEFLRTHRESQLVTGLTPHLLTVLPSGNFNVDSFFDITYEMEFSDGTTQSHNVTIRVNRMDMGMMIEFFDEDNECHTNPEACYFNPFETDEMKIEMFFKDFLSDYADESMTNDMINEKYFGWMAPEMLLSKRLEDNANGAAYVFMRLLPSGNFNVDSFFDITYQITYSDGTMVEETLTFRFIHYDMGLQMIPFDPMAERMDIVYMFTEFINDPSITVEEICRPFDADSQLLCGNIVAFHRDNGYTVWVDEIYVDEDNISVTLKTQGADGIDIETNVFELSKIMDNPLFTIKTTQSENPLYTPSEN
ncbi:hypothetical protein OAO42_00730 [Candidatus Izimaplasma bacterium]|nr:hypothetical protein [Candidatus Izimaplasma bacterium]